MDKELFQDNTEFIYCVGCQENCNVVGHRYLYWVKYKNLTILKLCLILKTLTTQHHETDFWTSPVYQIQIFQLLFRQLIKYINEPTNSSAEFTAKYDLLGLAYGGGLEFDFGLM